MHKRKLERDLKDLEEKLAEVNKERRLLSSTYYDGIRKTNIKQDDLHAKINTIDIQLRKIIQKENKRYLKNCITLNDVLTTDVSMPAANISELYFYVPSGLEVDVRELRFDCSGWSDAKIQKYNQIQSRFKIKPIDATHMHVVAHKNIELIRTLLHEGYSLSSWQYLKYKETSSSLRTDYLDILVNTEKIRSETK